MGHARIQHAQSCMLGRSNFQDLKQTNRLFPKNLNFVNELDSTHLANKTFSWLLYYDFFSTVTAIHHINQPSPTEVNNLYFYYNVDLKNRITYKTISWDFYLFNDYGCKYYFDSILQKTQDQFTLKNSLQWLFYKQKIGFSFSANTQTKLFNSYKFRINSSGIQEKFLYDGFMSPGAVIYSGGLQWQAPGNSSLNIGLGSSKVDKIKDQRIFDSRQESEINGLQKGDRRKSTLGVNLLITVPIQHFSKHVHWEFFGNAFAPMNSLLESKKYTVNVNNVFHAIFLKFVRVSWRTQIHYNKELFPKPVFQNQISLGFYLSNHL